jgi:hypothetical protein
MDLKNVSEMADVKPGETRMSEWMRLTIRFVVLMVLFIGGMVALESARSTADTPSVRHPAAQPTTSNN